MNTEINQEATAPMTPGQRLREARERLGLSQRVVAERLCLMVSTVKEIEEDSLSPSLAETFTRGYIRSYAKLVQVPEEEVLPAVESKGPERTVRIPSMQSFSMGKKRKKRDGWLMTFTWLVVFVVLGLTGAWWWQKHTAQKQEMAALVDSSLANAQENSPSQSGQGEAPAPTETPVPLTSQPPAEVAPSETQVPLAPLSHEPQNTPLPAPVASPTTTATPPVAVSPEAALNAAVIQAQLPASNGATPIADTSKGLQITFTNDCWIEVRDATDKVLISTLQRKGTSLNLQGAEPFKLKLGVPSAVQIQYQGVPFDMGKLAQSHQVVRLTIPAQP